MNRGDRDSSRASLYDRLRPRQSTLEQMARQQATPAPERRYDPDRLRVLDGVALTSAGLVGWGNVPAPAVPTPLEGVQSPGGNCFLCHKVVDTIPIASSPDGQAIDQKTTRLLELVHSLALEALGLLDKAPKNAISNIGFDIAVSLPSDGLVSTHAFLEYIRELLKASSFCQSMGQLICLDNSIGLHAAVAASVLTRPYILWISADSFCSSSGVVQLEQQSLLASPPRYKGTHPGEACAAVLLQRIEENSSAFQDGWWLVPSVGLHHSARAQQSRRSRLDSMRELINTVSSALVDSEPSVAIADVGKLPNRVSDVCAALFDHWSHPDAIEDVYFADSFCGWSGSALNAIQIVLAIAALTEKKHAGSALILEVASETTSGAAFLLPCSAVAEGVGGVQSQRGV